MADLTEQEATQLFNDVNKAMQEEDNGKLSSLLAVETPEVTEPPVQEPPLEEEPEELETKDDETKSPLEESSDDDDKKADKPEDTGEKPQELIPEVKRLAELEAQLKAAQKDNQALRSQAGRVPAIQRRLAELDKKLEEVRTASPSSQTSTKIKPKVEKLLEGIRETDPALADGVAQAIAAAMEGVDEELRTREEQQLTLLRTQEAGEYQQEQIARLTSMFPNAPEVFASPHWTEWKKTQPKHVLDLATSDSADAVAMAFEMYAKDMQAKYPELGKKAEASSETNPAEVEKANKLEQERLRKQKSEANLGTPKAGTRVAEPKDPQALFELFSKQIAEEMKG